MEWEKSSTKPGPSDSPANPVPAPRACRGISFSEAYWTQATTSADTSWSHYAQRTDLVDARVRGVHLYKHVVTTDVTVQQPSQVGLDPFSLLVHGRLCSAEEMNEYR